MISKEWQLLLSSSVLIFSSSQGLTANRDGVVNDVAGGNDIFIVVGSSRGPVASDAFFISSHIFLFTRCRMCPRDARSQQPAQTIMSTATAPTTLHPFATWLRLV